MQNQDDLILKENKKYSKKIKRIDMRRTLLMEVAWEVCNQVGGIYTVIRSKAQTMVKKWGINYCLIGPYINKEVFVEFEPINDLDIGMIGKTVKKLREQDIEVHYGRWLVAGKPQVILLNPNSVMNQIDDIKTQIWEKFYIPTPWNDSLINQIVAFGYLLFRLFVELDKSNKYHRHVIAHFHEWMSGIVIPQIRQERLDISAIFTTHATVLGRYLAMNKPNFYQELEVYNWKEEAKRYNVESQVHIERAAAHGAHVFTTVSEVTAKECVYLLGREPEVILPNGLNIERFSVIHELQNLHKEYKLKIHDFIMGHFFPSYSFDLDKTIYFFTSGRFEYRNKGFDLTLEALAKLNWKMQQQKIDATVVMFFITKRPYYSVNPQVLHSQAILEKLQKTCQIIQKQVGERLFYQATMKADGKLPFLNDFIDEYWKLRFRRTLHSWKSDQLPLIITHTLANDGDDEILNFLRSSKLLNHAHDRVKVVYHPDFVSSMSPIFQQEYDQFVRGCHLGIFPSYYEPWGYTPLECIARGIPTVTSNLSGFGDYVLRAMPKSQKKGIYIVDRVNQNFNESAEQLADFLLSFVKLTRRERIKQRNRIESVSVDFDWSSLSRFYERAYNLTLWRDR